MSRALIQPAGTGAGWGAAGVKTAKLCAEQDQIGRRIVRPAHDLRVGSLEGLSNQSPRGMMTTKKGLGSLL